MIPESNAHETIALVGQLLLGSSFERGALILRDGRIEDILLGAQKEHLPRRVFESAFIAPGFVDVQVNGAFGVEAGEDPRALPVLCERLVETGVTTFLPTLITREHDRYALSIETFRAGRSAIQAIGGQAGADPVGLHLEGPLLSPKRPGVHPKPIIEAARFDVFDAWLDPSLVKLVTLAPERPGALDYIRRLVSLGIHVSAGHTDATYAEMLAATNAGLSFATHLYNAMRPFTHRDPGLIGAILTDPRVTTGIIADGEHAHPTAVKLALQMKGPEGIALVTDSMTGAGMPPGKYLFDGMEILVDEITARDARGGLAGSTLLLDRAIRNVVAWSAATPAQALTMAATTPARRLGLTDRGSLQRGLRADIVTLSANLEVERTFVLGHCAFKAGAAS